MTKQLEERLTGFTDYEALPCPIQAETATQLPVTTDGIFFNLAPVEATTGLPLRVAPTVDLGELPRLVKNTHHGVFPHGRPEMIALSARAVREACIQTTLRTQHNEGPYALHNTWSGGQGPVMTADVYERIGQCVALRAGYIPDYVIDTSERVSRYRRATNDDFELLKQSRVPAALTRERIEAHAAKWGVGLQEAEEDQTREEAFYGATYRDFEFGIEHLRELFSKAIKQQITPDLAPTAYDEFIREGDTEAGLELISLGASALSRKAVLAGENLETTYDKFTSEGRLHPLAPTSAAELMVAVLGCRARRLRWLPEWRKDLRRMSIDF